MLSQKDGSLTPWKNCESVGKERGNITTKSEDMYPYVTEGLLIRL